MKRFLAFRGAVYYPSGGMDDYFKDFDTWDEAVTGVIAYAESKNVHDPENLWDFSWAHVWDSETRKQVWKNP